MLPAVPEALLLYPETFARKGAHASAKKAGHEGGSVSHGRSRSEAEDKNSGTSSSGNGLGFASQPKEKVREASRKGGEDSHQNR